MSITAKDMIQTDQYVLFWGDWPSQWFKCRFAIDGTEYNCCEQFMMAEKARVFGDEASLAKIMAKSSPRDQKALGRKVAGFDAEKWSRVCGRWIRSSGRAPTGSVLRS